MPDRDRPISPGELCSLGYDALRRLSDEQVVGGYEALRDQPGPSAHGTVYPNIARLHQSPLEREKDRREVWNRAASTPVPEAQAFYEEAKRRPVTWWLQHQLVAKHAFKSCMYCGVCTARCPAAQFYEEYNPRMVVDAVLSQDEERLEGLLRSDLLWFCGQCGSCKPCCPRENNLMGLISSLRMLCQLKGWHLCSVRGRQQYFARHLWGANFWNRGCSLYFRNAAPEGHPDFGPRWARYWRAVEAQMARVGASPDQDGLFGGRKLPPETLEELRACVHHGGTLALWTAVEEAAMADAGRRGVDLDAYWTLVGSEG